MENGLSTKKWGPSGWIFLHSVAQRYPMNPTPEDKRQYREFYTNIALPCGTCVESYTKYIEILPIEYFLRDRTTLLLWIYIIHNFVNYKLMAQGQKIDIPSFEEIYRKYEDFSKQEL